MCGKLKSPWICMSAPSCLVIISWVIARQDVNDVSSAGGGR